MRLLYVITRAERGGAQVHVAELLRGFRDRHEPVLAVGEEGYLTETARALGVPVYVLPRLLRALHPVKDLLALRDMRALLRTLRPDLVHAHTSKAGIVARLAARLVGVPSVFTAHTWAFTEGAPLHWRLVGLPAEWLATRCGDAVISVSHYNRRLARRYRIVPDAKLAVVYNGIPDSPHRARPAEGGEVRVVMVARFSPQKDHRLLLRAFAGVKAPARLQLVGDGPGRAAAEAEAQRLGLGGRVEFLGARDDVDRVLARAHVFALATNWESLPISIVEAMRAGLPVVASDVGGVREQVTDGITGFLIPQGDAALLRERLTRLAGDPALRVKMGAAGRARYEADFTVDRMLARSAAVYDALVAEMRMGAEHGRGGKWAGRPTDMLRP
jgi:glycosyltransferase involved in cell wall biosynthesis